MNHPAPPLPVLEVSTTPRTRNPSDWPSGACEKRVFVLIFQVSLRGLGTFSFAARKREGRARVSKQAKAPCGAVSRDSRAERPNSPPALRPPCSCRFFGCQSCCPRPLAFYPEPCCPWPPKCPRPSPRQPQAPAMFPDRSLQLLSPARTRRSPRRSPGGHRGGARRAPLCVRLRGCRCRGRGLL